MAAIAFDVALSAAEDDAAEPDMPEPVMTRDEWIKKAKACLTLAEGFYGRDEKQTERLRQEYLADAMDCAKCAMEARP